MSRVAADSNWQPEYVSNNLQDMTTALSEIWTDRPRYQTNSLMLMRYAALDLSDSIELVLGDDDFEEMSPNLMDMSTMALRLALTPTSCWHLHRIGMPLSTLCSGLSITARTST